MFQLRGYDRRAGLALSAAQPLLGGLKATTPMASSEYLQEQKHVILHFVIIKSVLVGIKYSTITRYTRTPRGEYVFNKCRQQMNNGKRRMNYKPTEVSHTSFIPSSFGQWSSRLPSPALLLLWRGLRDGCTVTRNRGVAKASLM